MPLHQRIPNSKQPHGYSMTTKSYLIDRNAIPSPANCHTQQQQRPPTPGIVDSSNDNSDGIPLHQYQQHIKRERRQSPQYHNSNKDDTNGSDADDDDSSDNANDGHRQQRRSTEKWERGRPRNDIGDRSSSIIQHANSTEGVPNNPFQASITQQQTQRDPYVTPPLPPSFSPPSSTPAKKKRATAATANDNDHKQSRTSSLSPHVDQSPSPSAATKPRTSSLADPNRTDKAGRTKLFAYTISGDLAKVKSMVVQGADVNFKDHAGWVPLHEAALKGQYDIANYLIDCGANVNIRGYGDDTPLHDACSSGHADMVQLLVNGGADVFALNASKQQPLDVCETQACKRIVEAKMNQLDRFITRDATGRTRLHHACADGFYDDVATLVNQGANVHAEDNHRWTPLHEAVRHGHLPIVRLLTQHGADINHAGSQGTTVLHHACHAGHGQVVRFLMDLGINIHAENDAGKTAYQIATNTTIRRDLAAKIDDERKQRATSDAIDEITFTTLRQRQRSNNPSSSTTTTTTSRHTPLSREERKIQAIMKSFQALEQQQQPSRPSRTSRRRTTSTTTAVIDNDEHNNRNSLSNKDKNNGIKVDQQLSAAAAEAAATRKLGGRRQNQTSHGNTATPTRSPSRERSIELSDTASASNDTTSKGKSKKPNTTKLDPHKRDTSGRTQLHRWASRGDVDQVQALLQVGADPNATDYAGYTPLHEASLHGRSSVVKLLLENGANVDTKGADLETALHDAIDNEHADVVAILLQFGADPHLENSKGMSPMETAREQDLGEIQQSLKHAMLNCKRKTVHDDDDDDDEATTTLPMPSPSLSHQHQNEEEMHYVSTRRQAKKRRLVLAADLEPSSSSPICQRSSTSKLQHLKTEPSSLVINPMDIHTITEKGPPPPLSASTPTLGTTSRRKEPTPPLPLSLTYEPPHTPIPAPIMDDRTLTKKRKEEERDNDDKAVLDHSRRGNDDDDSLPDQQMPTTTNTPLSRQSRPRMPSDSLRYLPLYTVQLVEDDDIQSSLYVLDLQVALLLNLSTDTFWQRYPHLRRRQVTFKEKERLWSPLASMVCTAAQVTSPPPSDMNVASLATTPFHRDQEKRSFLDLSLYFVYLDPVVQLIKQDYDDLSRHLITITLDIGYHQDQQPSQSQQHGQASDNTLTWTSTTQHLNHPINSHKNAYISKTPLKKRPTFGLSPKFAVKTRPTQ